MNIVQLSTSDMGGAGIAAKQLHLQLLNNHVNSTFLTKVKLGNDIQGHQIITPEKKKGLMNAIVNRLSNTIKYRFPFFDNNLNYYLKNRKSGFEYFSFPFSDIDLTSVDSVRNADIVHLHWISDGFVDYKNVFSLNKKYVWTLHDMNPFTGGCHSSDGCMKFQTNCNYCFQLEGTPDEYISYKILDYKLNALSKLDDDQLTIITPSQFLSDLSKTSKCFSRFKHVVIPNVIDFPMENTLQPECRRKLGIGDDKMVFLFVAHHVGNVRKGIYVLKEALAQLSHKENIRLITIGEKSGLQIAGIETIELGFLTDKLKIKEAYTAADAFLLPSMGENFPNTIVESLITGTPVIASNVGGIPEQVNDKNGILAEANSVKDWVRALNYFIDHKQNYNREEIEHIAKSKYDVNRITEEHLKIYQDLIH